MNRAAQLRLAFDRSFADAPTAASGGFVDVLAIRIGTEAYAIALADVAGLQVDVRITAVPTRSRELLGIAAVGGALASVYDLRFVLGVAAEAAPRWIVRVAAQPVAYAFDAFEGLVRLPGACSSFEHEGRTRVVLDLVAIDSLLRDRSGKEL
jgi:purine-binding chemotaxis protein CheW